MMRQCVQCESEIPDGAKFCPSCGAQAPFDILRGGRQKRTATFSWSLRSLGLSQYQTRQAAIVLAVSVVAMPVVIFLLGAMFPMQLAYADYLSGGFTVVAVVVTLIYFGAAGYWFVRAVEVPWWWSIGAAFLINVISNWVWTPVFGGSSSGFFLDWVLPLIAGAVGGMLAANGGRRTPWKRWD